MAKVRQKDAEAALDAKIRRIKEENRLREEREREVEADRQLARAAGSDEARVSRYVRYTRTPSPGEERHEGGRRGGRDRDGAGFLRDRARDGQERGGQERGERGGQERAERGGGRGERAGRSRPQQQQRREETAWRLERQQIDQRRVERSRTSDGGWRREWDRQKEPTDLHKEEPKARGVGGGDARPRRQRSPAAVGDPTGLRRPAAREDGIVDREPDSRSECYSVDMKGRDMVFTYSCSYIN